MIPFGMRKVKVAFNARISGQKPGTIIPEVNYMELPIEQNLDNTGRMIRAGVGLSLLGLALFPPGALKTSKSVTLLASLGTLSLVEAGLGYCVGAEAVSRLRH